MERRTSAADIAMGGVMAALAIVIMCLGTLLGVTTFVCPMLCMLLLQFIHKRCGSRIGWAWYAAVAVLGALLCPDKEAAAVFLFLGYYPILKPKFDGLKLKNVWKLLYFNASALVMYWVLMYLLGMDRIVQEFKELGTLMTAVTLVLGNVTFFLLDVILGRRLKFRRRS